MVLKSGGKLIHMKEIKKLLVQYILQIDILNILFIFCINIGGLNERKGIICSDICHSDLYVMQ